MIVGNKTEGALIMMIASWGKEYDSIKQAVYHEEKGDKIYNFNSGKATWLHLGARGPSRPGVVVVDAWCYALYACTCCSTCMML
jgi:hypothetical protein